MSIAEEVDKIKKDYMHEKGVQNYGELSDADKAQLQSLVGAAIASHEKIEAEKRAAEEERKRELAARAAEAKANETPAAQEQEASQSRPLGFLFYTRTFGCFLTAVILFIVSKGSIIYILLGILFVVFGILRVARIMGKDSD